MTENDQRKHTKTDRENEPNLRGITGNHERSNVRKSNKRANSCVFDSLADEGRDR